MRIAAIFVALAFILTACEKMPSMNDEQGEDGNKAGIEQKTDAEGLDVEGEVAAPFVILHTKDGDVSVQVEVAWSEHERAKGLKGRESLGKDQGMWFVFDNDGDYKFWMEGMNFNLDMVFVNSDGEIVGMVEDARAGSTDAIGVDKPFKYVLEVDSGFVKKNDLALGDKVDWMLNPATK